MKLDPRRVEKITTAEMLKAAVKGGEKYLPLFSTRLHPRIIFYMYGLHYAYV
jgi:hypothetical protein